MPKIIKLEQHVADLIAAGEVVQRPASVVKELIENSIDAGASSITVEIASGGMALIRVSDNGSGIAQEDTETAFLRHATSKLRDANGLEAISTLGFRGEALAAISAVSRIELRTRQSDADEGIRLVIEAGEVLDMSPTGCPEGTTIIVSDLFFNTPARFKFMKSDRSEGSGCASVVLRCALSRPDIAIRFIKDGKTEYHTPGDSRIDSCVYSLLGREISEGFLNAESSDEAVTVKGFVSKPSAARGNRSYQFFFINGRSIRSLLLQSALEQAFKNTLPNGRFPSCVLYITTAPGNVDVNVHPAKTEVKFSSDKQVFNAVYYAALGALEREKAECGEPEVSSNKELKMGYGELDAATHWKAESGTRKVTNEDSGYTRKKDYISNQVEEYRSNYTPNVEDHKVKHTPNIDNSQFSILNSQFQQSDFRVIGEALSVYIIIEQEGSIWFIDKHAAHERIHFDALKSGIYEPMSEALISPVICRLGHEDVAVLLDAAAFLDKLGFTVESFGEDSIAVRHIPADIDIGDTESVLSQMCPDLKHSGVAEPATRDNIFKLIACKAAIKAGRSSDTRELEVLAAKVMSGEISTCPHGRPLSFELTGSALDKRFGKT